MTLAFDFHPEAQAEFTADVDWYDDRELGLGGRFADAVRAVVDAAVDYPEAGATWPGWDRNPVVRSRRVRTFPYRVVHFVEADLLTIVAVAHTRRRRATGETASAGKGRLGSGPSRVLRPSAV